ncbi:hypothetical protein I3842_05G249200 [Carya illinoinensis]|uniref:Uncharacterized protein n=1 Tax=Carya illinoinensis TaxID=32201 RepID=A0A922F4V1_CARIL|nr:hypothetical protein I3842_05G249200 [Carya illinoinensis]
MPSITSPQWHEMASSFFSSSREKLKEAGQSAEKFIGKVAKDAKRNFTHVAKYVGSVVNSRWAFLQQPSTRNAVHERLISVAATTSTLLRKVISETNDKVVVKRQKLKRWQRSQRQKVRPY